MIISNQHTNLCFIPLIAFQAEALAEETLPVAMSELSLQDLHLLDMALLKELDYRKRTEPCTECPKPRCGCCFEYCHKCEDTQIAGWNRARIELVETLELSKLP